MPFINTKVSTEITRDNEVALKTAFGKAMSLIGKPEAYLMLSFEDNCRLWFSGDNSLPCAFIDVSILHSAPRASYELLTEALCKSVEDILLIPSDRIYVKFEETENWGHNGYMF